MFRRRKPGEALDAELRFHLEQQMQSYVSRGDGRSGGNAASRVRRAGYNL